MVTLAREQDSTPPHSILREALSQLGEIRSWLDENEVDHEEMSDFELIESIVAATRQAKQAVGVGPMPAGMLAVTLIGMLAPAD